jgi:hypothetical protein
MRTRILTSLSALALLVVASAAAQLPDENVELQPAAPAESTATTTTPEHHSTTETDAVIGEADAPDQDSTQPEPLAEESAAVQAPAEPPAEMPMDSAEVESQGTDTSAEVSAESGEELPRTASPLALIALLGAGSVGSAFSLRFARRRR